MITAFPCKTACGAPPGDTSRGPDCFLLAPMESIIHQAIARLLHGEARSWGPMTLGSVSRWLHPPRLAQTGAGICLC